MTSKEAQQGLAAQPAFFPVLAAAGRSAEIPGDADVYGFLVGSWDLDVRRYAGCGRLARRRAWRGACGMGARGTGHPGRLDHARPLDAASGAAARPEHVRDDAPVVGPGAERVADPVEQSCRKPLRTADRPADGQ